MSGVRRSLHKIKLSEKSSSSEDSSRQRILSDIDESDSTSKYESKRPNRTVRLGSVVKNSSSSSKMSSSSVKYSTSSNSEDSEASSPVPKRNSKKKESSSPSKSNVKLELKSGRILSKSAKRKSSSSLEGLSSEEKKEESSFGSRKDWATNLSKNKMVITSVTEPRSNCIIAFAEEKDTINPRKVVLKITLGDVDKNNSLSVERRIYSEIVPIMLKKSPHFVKYIDDFLLPGFKKTLSSIVKGEDKTNRYEAAEILYQIGKIEKSNRYSKSSNSDIHMLIIERAPGKTLEDWLDSSLYKKFFTEKQKKQFDMDIAMQVAYTLSIMAEEKVMHNDFHNANLYVVEREKTRLPYQINGKSFSSKYFVYFFDYDHSSVENKIENTYLTNAMCAKFGECNHFTPKWDWFTFLDEYCYHAEDTVLKQLFPDWEMFTDGEVFRNVKGARPHRGRACICIDKDCSGCKVSSKLLNRITSLEDFMRLH